MVIEVSFVQFSNALLPMLVMLEPMVNSSKAVPLKNSFGMLVTLSPRVTFFRAVAPLNMPFTGVQLTVATERLLQPSKGVVPMFVTEEGIVIEVSPDFLNALLPIVVTVVGIVKELSAEQFSKRDTSIFVIFPLLLTVDKEVHP